MNISEVHAMGIHMLPGYSDPYHGRPLTKGELGCFLSHYNIWKEVNLRSQAFEHLWTGKMVDALINLSGLRLWSDACSPPWWLKTTCASRSFSNVAWWTWWVRWRMKGWTGISCELALPLQSLNFSFTLLSFDSQFSFLFLSSSYIGRKRMQVDHPEKAVPNIHNLVEADYSYWTLGYMISLQGAEKLLKAEPLKRILPVDEFLPIMYNKHPV